MSANPQRRRFLGLFAAAPLAAAAGVRPASVLGRAGATSLSIRATDGISAQLAGLKSRIEGIEPSIAGVSAWLDRAHPLEFDIEPASSRFSGLLSRLNANPASIAAQQAAEARAIAALAPIYPPEIAAYRSFGAPMRRRLYAELLLRETARLSQPNAAAAE